MYPELALYQEIMPQQVDQQLKQITLNNLNVLFTNQQIKFLSGEWECYQAALLAIFCAQPTDLKHIWDEPNFYGIPFITEMFCYEDILAFLECYSPQNKVNSQLEPTDGPINKQDDIQEELQIQNEDSTQSDSVVIQEQEQLAPINLQVPLEIQETINTVNSYISLACEKFLEFKAAANGVSMRKITISQKHSNHQTFIQNNLNHMEDNLLGVFDSSLGFCYNFVINFAQKPDTHLNIFKKLINIFTQGQVKITADNYFFSKDSIAYCKSKQYKFLCALNKNYNINSKNLAISLNTWKLVRTHPVGPQYNITSYMYANQKTINFAHTWVIDPGQAKGKQIQSGDGKPDAFKQYMTHFKGIDSQINKLFDTLSNIGVTHWTKKLLFAIHLIIIRNCQIIWNQENPNIQYTIQQYAMTVAKQLKKTWFPVFVRNRFSNTGSSVKHYQINVAFNKNVKNKLEQRCSYCKSIQTYLSCTCGTVVCATCFHRHLIAQLNSLIKE
ncbi:Transposase_IS4 [Hexamita inflata]|uniref:Transposase IS4 n=1 Tax=Hexamita inflata TaxID=28002 RepID=A0AA86P160_9EUKA|nr:Transposase IS4 [Hexamita inflata]